MSADALREYLDENLPNLSEVVGHQVRDSVAFQFESVGVFRAENHQIECHVSVDLQHFAEQVLES